MCWLVSLLSWFVKRSSGRDEAMQSAAPAIRSVFVGLFIRVRLGTMDYLHSYIYAYIRTYRIYGYLHGSVACLDFLSLHTERCEHRDCQSSIKVLILSLPSRRLHRHLGALSVVVIIPEGRFPFSPYTLSSIPPTPYRSVPSSPPNHA